MSNQENLRKIASGAFLLFIGIFISKIIAYFYKVIIARYLGPSDYGTLSLALSIFGIFGAISLIGLDFGILRYVSFYRGKKDYKNINKTVSSALIITTFLSVLVGIILFFLSDYISLRFFHNKELSIIIKIFAIGLPFRSLVTNFTSIAQAFQKINYMIYSRNIIENLAKLLITIILIILGYKIVGVAVANIAALFISMIILFYFINKSTYKIINSIKKPKFFDKELLSFSFPLLFSQIFIMLVLWVDTIILGYFKESSSVGIYNAAIPLAEILFMAPVTITTIFTPIITELYSQNKNIEQVYKISTKWIFLINIPIFLVLLFFTKTVLYIFFGEEYISGYIALLILTIFFFIKSFLFNQERILLMLKKTKLISLNVGLAFLTNLVLSFLLIPKYGIMGAAIASGLGFFVQTMLTYVETLYFTKIKTFSFNYIKIGFSGIISILIIYFSLNTIFKKTSIPILIVALALFLLLYVLFLLITRSLSKEDRDVIKQAQKKIGIKAQFIDNILERFT